MPRLRRPCRALRWSGVLAPLPLLPLDCAADAAAVTESGLHDDRRVERTCGARRRGDCTVTQSRVAVEVYRSARRLGLAHNCAKGSTANLCSESLSGRLHMQPHPHPQHALNLCSLGLLVRACAPALAKPFPTKRISHVNSAENSMEQMPLFASAEKVLRPPLRLNLNFPPSTPVPTGMAWTAAAVEKEVGRADEERLLPSLPAGGWRRHAANLGELLPQRRHGIADGLTCVRARK